LELAEDLIVPSLLLDSLDAAVVLAALLLFLLLLLLLLPPLLVLPPLLLATVSERLEWLVSGLDSEDLIFGGLKLSGKSFNRRT
jgi:hypothetical protein